jgi:hypothetical protein
LHFDGATHRIDDTGEHEEQPIPGGFNDTAPVFLDLGMGQLAAKRLWRGEGSLLVSPPSAASSRPRRRRGSLGADGRLVLAREPPWRLPGCARFYINRDPGALNKRGAGRRPFSRRGGPLRPRGSRRARSSRAPGNGS